MRTSSLDPQITKVFANVDPASSEVIVHELYHIKELAGKSDGTVSIAPELSFFQIQTGQADDNGLATTYEDTNMEVAGKIGTPYKFWGQSLSAFVLPSKSDTTPAIKTFDKLNPQAAFVNDAYKLLMRGNVSVNVLNQPIIRVAPIMGIPGGIGAQVPAIAPFDADFNTSPVQNGVAIASNRYPIDLYLEDQLSFTFKVSFPAGVFALYNNLRLGFKIHGLLIRPRQGGK